MKASSTLQLLEAYESRNVTFIEPDGSWPIVWQRAKGVHVWDDNHKRYLDLTAAFGVAAAGHANPRVVAAGRRQMGTLLHAMGDVHPHRLKAELARELSRITFERWSDPSGASGFKGKTIFCNSGFEAVEAALKTAMLVTGKPGVIVFEQAYHGLGYGALNVTHRSHFRGRFTNQLREFGTFVPFPSAATTNQRSSTQLERLEAKIRSLLRSKQVGAILAEPVQARGGINVPPPAFLPMLRRLSREHGALLILDEIYTGFGRTGKWFACEHSRVMPDIVCLGKALTGGFPLSACVGRADLMDAGWPASTGEAIHTSTFLGHPVGCTMALAHIREIQTRHLVSRSAQLGRFLLSALFNLIQARQHDVGLRLLPRGLGLLVGLELRHPDGSAATKPALAIIKSLLHRGFILLPEGEHANTISFTPPLTISQPQLHSVVVALEQALGRRTWR